MRPCAHAPMRRRASVPQQERQTWVTKAAIAVLSSTTFAPAAIISLISRQPMKPVSPATETRGKGRALRAGLHLYAHLRPLHSASAHSAAAHGAPQGCLHLQPPRARKPTCAAALAAARPGGGAQIVICRVGQRPAAAVKAQAQDHLPSRDATLIDVMSQRSLNVEIGLRGAKPGRGESTSTLVRNWDCKAGRND